MSTSTTSINCPKTLPVPFTVTVNTSGTTPTGADAHPAASTHAGFTRISKFTLTPVVTALAGIPDIETFFSNKVSNSIAKWDFGDGYTLSGSDAFTTTHIYNVPGIYTVTVFLYDKDSNAYPSTFTEEISVYNYANTIIAVETRNITEQDGINARNVTAGENKTFNLETTAAWQDVPSPADPQTFFFTASGSQTKPYDFNNKYAHVVPYNAFYDKNNKIINNAYGLKEKLYPHYFYVNSVDSTIVESAEQDSEKNEAVLLYSSTDEYIDSISPRIPSPIKFSYYDDVPDTIVNLLIRIDTSRHRIKNFYVDNIDTNINNSNRNFLEADIARPIIKDKSTINTNVGNSIGIPVKVIAPFTSRLSFTSTGMKEMSSIQYKRQGNKFQVLVALADDKLNIGKYYSQFFREPINNFITLLNSDFSSALSGSYLDPSKWTIAANILTVDNNDFSTTDDWTAAISNQLNQSESTGLSGWVLNGSTASHNLYGLSPTPANWNGIHPSVNNLYQDVGSIAGKKYTVKVLVAGCTAGTLSAFVGEQKTSTNGLPLSATADVTDNAYHKINLKADGANPQNLYFQASNDFNGNIDNVSIRESHDGGLGDGESGWNWSSGAATHTLISTWTGSDEGLDNLYQDINTTLGNEYIIKLTISSCTDGHIRVFLGSTDPTPPWHRPGLSANEAHTVVVKATDNEPQRLFIQATADFNGQVDDISIDSRQFYADWTDGNITTTSNISSLCTTNLPFNTVSNKTELSSFLYLNIDPLSAGTWTLNVSGRLDSFINSADPARGQIIDHDPDGPLGPVSIGTDSNLNLITGSYTFTVFPSTNDVEIYKINEDVDYSQILKSYRFQSLQLEYDKLFDGIFTSFVGEASSSPTTFGKTIFEKIANFTMNNSDIDFCNIKNLESFYDLFNEDIDISIPEPPPELKRLYNLFSIKISKLLGDYERYDRSFDTQFYTSSAASRNIDFNNPITSSTYTVTAGTPFVAKQKFNSEYILIKPQKIPNLSAAGEVDTNEPVLSAYYLSAYNLPVLSGFSNWGWPLDTTISSTSGLDLFYEFYPYTAYSIISAENIQNSIIDYNNNYNTITRASSSLSANWHSVGGIVFKNLDYQIRKGLQL